MHTERLDSSHIMVQERRYHEGYEHIKNPADIHRRDAALYTYTTLDFRTCFQKPRPGDETALLARAGLGT
jgi:hypothetical protein